MPTANSTNSVTTMAVPTPSSSASAGLPGTECFGTPAAGATVIAVLATEVYGRSPLVGFAVGESLSAVVAPVATVPTLVRR
jgi:hypothetical protein